jgi:hypothetical protein
MTFHSMRDQVRALGIELERFARGLDPEQQALLSHIMIRTASLVENESAGDNAVRAGLDETFVRLADQVMYRDDRQAAQNAAERDGC